MATFLGIAIIPLLEKAGAAILSAAGSYVVKKGTDAVQGGSDTDKIRQDLAQVSSEIAGVRNAVDAMSSQLTDTLLQLRKDDLQHNCTSILTRYNSVLDALKTYLEHIAEPESEAQRDLVENSIDRIDELLEQACNEIPGYLEQIHAFLNERGNNSFFGVAAQRALVQSADLLAYYGKVKALALSYWIYVAKGIALLKLAADYPGINFAEGHKTIERQTRQLQDQERALRAVIGEDAADLAEAIFNNPDGRTPVLWKAGDQLCGVRIWYEIGSGNRAMCHGPPVKWFLQPKTKLDSFNLTIGSKYGMYLFSDECEGRLEPRQGYYGAQMMDLGRSFPCPDWWIKPYEIGSKKFTIEFQKRWVQGGPDVNFLDMQPKGVMGLRLMPLAYRPEKGKNPGGLFEFSLIRNES